MMMFPFGAPSVGAQNNEPVERVNFKKCHHSENGRFILSFRFGRA